MSFLKFGFEAGPDVEAIAGADNDWLADRVVAALWKAFPEAESNTHLSELAAPYFRTKAGEPIQARTVRLWLERVSLPTHRHTMTLIAMVGWSFWFLDPRAPTPETRRA